jgi:hypothetical protein
MSKSRRNGKTSNGRERHLSVRAVRRDPPDLRKLSRALIELAMAQAEADAEQQAKAARRERSPEAGAVDD